MNGREQRYHAWHNFTSKIKRECPQFPHFGALYPDACCIAGRLWDLDSCEGDDGLLHSGGDDPCPFCNPRDYFYWVYDPLNGASLAKVIKHMRYLRRFRN